MGAEGKPLRTAEYLEYLVGILGGYYDDEAKLRAIWSDPKNRRELLGKLRELNIDEEQLNEATGLRKQLEGLGSSAATTGGLRPEDIAKLKYRSEKRRSKNSK